MTTDLKYYLYVSDTKVDMLFSQIPLNLAERISTEFKRDLKRVSLSLKPETNAETRYSKLKVVIEYLRRNELLGTVSSPGSYFSGQLPMAFTVLGPTAVFCGRKDHTLIGLTGSAHHLTGQSGKPTDVALDSISHMVIGSVAKTLSETLDESIPDSKITGKETSSSLAFISQRIEHGAKNLEFVARTMDLEDVTNKKWGEAYREYTTGIKSVLLASPLYVALPE